MSSATGARPAPVPVVAGVDVATAAVRVVCADARGRVLAAARAPITPPVRGAAGRSEQDARSW
ncbi:carbohydrate kinase, partial [Streptomyces sp. SID10853]|nr:carbohydrate kinase [Streptomyces sp. SID10853]